jgi:hypothetical protein
MQIGGELATKPNRFGPALERFTSSKHANFWTVIASIATVIALLITLVSLAGNNNSPVAATASSPSVPVPDPTSSSGSPGRATPSASASSSPLKPMYAKTALRVELDGCGRDDDIDMDVPQHPYLESAAEIDFSSCMQGVTYVVGKNGAAISKAAPPDADHDQCMRAVEEEPAGLDGIQLQPGLVVCAVHFDEQGHMRVFRLLIRQVSGSRPRLITLTALGWK